MDSLLDPWGRAMAAGWLRHAGWRRAMSGSAVAHPDLREGSEVSKHGVGQVATNGSYLTFRKGRWKGRSGWDRRELPDISWSVSDRWRIEEERSWPMDSLLGPWGRAMAARWLRHAGWRRAMSGSAVAHPDLREGSEVSKHGVGQVGTNGSYLTFRKGRPTGRSGWDRRELPDVSWSVSDRWRIEEERS